LQQAQRRESVVQAAADVANQISSPMQLARSGVRLLADSVVPLLNLVRNYHRLLESDTASSAERRASIEELATTLDLDLVSREIPRALAEAEENLTRIASIVDAMKGVANASPTATEPTDFNTAVRNTVAAARNRWKSVADIELELADKLPLVPSDVADLNQVVMNLLANAADTLIQSPQPDRKGRIVVTTRVDGDRIEIGVRDNGPGVAEGAATHVFDPGQRLAMSRDVIVSKHSGTLTCDSLPGVATTYRIRIPVQRAAAATARRA
jgi:signal transduction histidine kinase